MQRVCAAPYYIVICGLSGFTICTSFKRHDFPKKKVIEYKLCVLIFSKTVIYHSKNNSARYYHKWAYVVLHVKYSLFLSDFNFSDRFRKINQIWDFIKIRPLEAELFYADGRRNGLEANSRFSQFCERAYRASPHNLVTHRAFNRSGDLQPVC